jgi:hypothetical protein
MHRDGAAGPCESVGRLLNGFSGYARHFAGSTPIESSDGGLYSIEACRVLFNECIVLKVVSQHHIHHPAQQRQIRARPQLQK